MEYGMDESGSTPKWEPYEPYEPYKPYEYVEKHQLQALNLLSDRYKKTHTLLMNSQQLNDFFSL